METVIWATGYQEHTDWIAIPEAKDAADYLNSLPDPLDDDGNVIVSQQPGLGLDLNWQYIEENRLV